MSSQWEQVCKGDKVSTKSSTLQKSSASSTWGEVTWAEGFPYQDDEAQAGATVVKTEKLVLEEQEESEMGGIFTVVQLLIGTGPNRQLTEVS